MVYGQFQLITGSCGIGNIYDYTFKKYGAVDRKSLDTINQDSSYYDPFDRHGGAGWQLASFAKDYYDKDNTQVSKEAYEILCKTRRLIFQSPVRKNKNSGNMFFFCVFDRRKTKKAKEEMPTIEAKWPF